MLCEIRIRDLGVIDEAVIALHPGLTVLTGETGAGKTMVVSGLGLLLGDRADAGLVRAGAGRAVIEGIVELPADHPAMVRAAEAGAEVDDGLVLIRTVTAEGRSRAHVGGRSAPVSVLGELAEHLVAVHGQADQWRLRRPDQHRRLLDDFGGADLLAARTAYEQLHDELAHTTTQIEELEGAARDRLREADVLRFGLDAIEAADPQPGEDRELRTESERLSHAADLRSAADDAVRLLGGDDLAGALSGGSVVDALGTARAGLTHAGANDPELAALAERTTEVGHLVGELVTDLAAYAAGVDLDPARLEWVEQRRATLQDLTRRYGADIDEVLAWGARSAARVAELDGADDRLVGLRHRVLELEAAAGAAADRLTAARTAAAGVLGEAATGELGRLAMGRALVTVAVTPRATRSRSGADDVEILLAANPGTPPASIAKAASGGELSRVMLALEVATATRQGLTPTFVFDEVDAGVGGRAALEVGSRLAALAAHAQVVVVTHLAQVAAYADRHLVVTKASDGHVTASGVVEVTGADRAAELARMMAGGQSARATEHARELLASVRAERSARRS